MNAIMSFLRGGLRFASPSYYQAEYANIVRGVHADMTAGSIRPLFQGMLVVGVVGYTMEYITIGRWHVIDKQAVLKKALENVHH